MKRILFLSFGIVLSLSVFANKTSVRVAAPSEAKKGSEVSLKIDVMHKGNSGSHHTDQVTVKVNGKEVKKWTYDKKNLPPAGDFELTYSFTMTEDAVVEVKGDCNLHGSTGAQNVTVKAVD